MMHNWRNLAPVYVPALSGANILAQGELFWLGDGELVSHDILPRHWHDSYEMGFIIEGHGIIALGDHEYPYQAGQVYIINDLEPHMAYTYADCTRLFVVHFHPSLLHDSWLSQKRTEAHIPFLADFNPQGPLIPVHDPVTEPVRAILEQIREEDQHRRTAWEIIVGGLIFQAIGHLARRLLDEVQTDLQDPKRRQSLKQIQPILHMIEARYAEPISLDDMAQAGHVSRSHCCALFQAALNTTPIAYRNARRLTEARRLLQNTDKTVREIAYQVGFSSVQQFNRLFLRETSMTPTAFREQFFEKISS